MPWSLLGYGSDSYTKDGHWPCPTYFSSSPRSLSSLSWSYFRKNMNSGQCANTLNQMKQSKRSSSSLHQFRWRFVDLSQFAFTTVLLYHTAIYCTKFSILAFYAKLFPTTAHILRTLCSITIGYTIACYFCAILLAIFWCGLPVTRNFEIGPGACTVWNYTLFKVNFAMNISSDIFSETPPFRQEHDACWRLPSLLTTFPIAIDSQLSQTPSCRTLRDVRTRLDHDGRECLPMHRLAEECIYSLM